MAHALLGWYWNLGWVENILAQPRRVGLSPQLDFSASQNVENISIEWPAPNIFGSDELPRLDTKNRSFCRC